MKTIKIILLVFTVFGFFACEQTLESEEIPYELRLVINGQLKAGEPVEDIYVGRTLPISYSYQEDFANLEDAQVGIIYKDSLYLLEHTTKGRYRNLDLPVVAGETYSLVVQYKTLFATGETTIPLIGEISNLSVAKDPGDPSGNSVLSASIIPFKKEAYGVIWISFTVNNQRDFTADKFGTIMIGGVQGFGSGMRVYSDEIPTNILNAENHYFGADIYAFDNSFYRYYLTRGSAQIEDAVFGSPNSSVKWNIEGDGIGVFIGRNDTTVTLR